MLLIKPRHNQHKHRAHSTLHHTQKEPLRPKTHESSTASRRHHHYAPDEDDGSGDALDGEALGQQHGGDCAADEADVED